MNIAYLLDTTVLIDHAKGRADGVEILARVFEETSRLYTCDVVTTEALSGGTPEERAVMMRLLDALDYLAIDPDGARWAGLRRRELRARNAADLERFGVPVMAYGEGRQASAGTKRGSTP